MAAEWTETTIGEFAPFHYGRSLPERSRNPKGEVPVFGSNGIVGFHDEPLTTGPTVIIGRKGTVGSVHYCPEPCWPIDTTFWISESDTMLLRFKYYLLKSLGLEYMNADSAVPGLNRDAVHARRVSVPPVDDQRAIAHILGTLDDKIELNRRMSETLEAMARAIFKAWFVEFEPVRAKMEGRWRRGESLPGSPAHLYDLFPDRLVTSEFDEIPDGWAVGQVADVVEVLREPENPLDAPDTVFSLYSIPAYDEGQEPKLEQGRNIKSVKFRVPAGAILISKLNPEIERVWIPDIQAGGRAICSTEFLVLRPRPPYGRSYVYCLARSPLFRRALEGLATGTSRSHQRVSSDAVLSIPTVIPPAEVVVTFERLSVGLLTRALAARREIRVLAALRDALLPKLVSGELRVKDIERLVGSAAG